MRPVLVGGVLLFPAVVAAQTTENTQAPTQSETTTVPSAQGSSTPPGSSAAPATTTGSTPASTPAPLPTPAPAVLEPSITFGAYAEAFYAYNFNAPSNAITALRGFDNRHNTFSLSNIALDVNVAYGQVAARIGVQFGLTPDTYYAAEPSRAGGAGVPATSLAIWRFLQQANVSWRAPLGNGLLLELGLFLSPIGPEAMAVRDNWNWSRSNLFFGLPFYHTGFRASYALTDRMVVSAAVFNGWNSVVDNNDEKSIALQFTYNDPSRASLSVVYFSGVERNPGALEGRAWRHDLDANFTYWIVPSFAVMLHGNVGVEPNTLGVAWWAAGAVSARLRVREWLYLAARGDFFYESVPSMGSAIFWPVPWVSSFTGTVDLRPLSRLSFRIEYRHDEAADNAFYAGTVPTNLLGEFVANARAQNTLTAGAVVWY